MTHVWIKKPNEGEWMGFSLEHVVAWGLYKDGLYLWTVTDTSAEAGIIISHPETIARVCGLLGMSTAVLGMPTAELLGGSGLTAVEDGGNGNG